ncbi:helix-turn-helix transcriptional regulator [Microvirga sp. BT689]|uniref:helix-turn-helix transcriptional regulator n=1 Tax=Microvirga arvi TaxID=2778731 RepID=UPI00194EC463|nr:helix-turn-helix transcriptional regulator [Microvirga arvi]MBM6579379.1 helix-turn-helix transcriptional regulator [Microvirga arvi]
MNGRAITAAILISGTVIYFSSTPVYAHSNPDTPEPPSRSSEQHEPDPRPNNSIHWWIEEVEEKKTKRLGPQHSPRNLGTILDSVPWGVLVVDGYAKIVFANRPARSFLDAGCGIEERQGYLHIHRSSVGRKLQVLIHSVTTRDDEDQSPDQRPREIGIPDQRGCIRYAAQVLPAQAYIAQPLALILVSDLVEQIPIRREAIAAVFNLSGREAELAELFAGGLCINEIAQRMTVSVNTIRAHLRHVFRKTGCSSQVQLARMFARML